MAVTERARRSQYPIVGDKAVAAARAPVEFRDVYDAEVGYVWRTLRRLGVHARDLEDLCHDVFVVVFRHLNDYDPRRPIRPWLFGIAYRVASDYRRSARLRHEVTGASAEPASTAPPADEALAHEEARALVLRALDALTLERRAVLVMHDIDGQVMPEIAAALGVPLNTAYSRLRLARADFVAAVRRAQGRGEHDP